MHTTHVSSGGRYPVLRTLAILYLIAAVGVLVLGIWRAVDVLMHGDSMANDVFGVSSNAGGRLLVAASWLAATFIGVLAMFGVAELIKLFIDIERNTRLAGMRAAAGAGDIVVASDPISGTTAVITSSGPDAAGAPMMSASSNGGRMGQWLEGEETAEGALLRGH